MSLYTELRDAGCTLDNHYSDLYVLSEPKADAIILEHRGRAASALSRFKSQRDGRLWWDVPFCFDPYWEAVHERVKAARER